MTITSMAPLKVAGLIEFQVLETEPLILRTYCIPQSKASSPAENLELQQGYFDRKKQARASEAGVSQAEAGIAAYIQAM